MMVQPRPALYLGYVREHLGFAIRGRRVAAEQTCMVQIAVITKGESLRDTVQFDVSEFSGCQAEMTLSSSISQVIQDKGFLN